MDAALDAGLRAARKALEASQYEAALEALTNTLNRARDINAPEGEMLSLGLLGPTLAALGRMEEAERALTKAIALAESRDDDESREHFTQLLATLSANAELAGISEDGDPLSEQEIGNAFDQAADLLTYGDPAMAIPLLEALCRVTRAQNLTADEASACGMLAQALALTGRSSDAAEPAARGLAIAEELGDPEAAAHFGQIIASLKSGDAQALVQAQTSERVMARCAEAGKLLDAEDSEGAIALLAEAAQEAAEAGAGYAEAGARGQLAQVLMLSGKREEATTEAERALELAKDLGDSQAAEQFQELIKMTQGWATPVADA